MLNHKLTISRIAQSLGSDASSKEHLSKCLYYFVVGSNDYINNYYQPEYYPTSSIFTPEEYATVLVQQYSQHLRVSTGILFHFLRCVFYDALTQLVTYMAQTLYNFGARKVSVSGLAPLGCLPAVLARGTNGSVCDNSINNAVRLFNDKLKILVNNLSNNLTDAKFVYIRAMDLRPVDLFAPGQ